MGYIPPPPLVTVTNYFSDKNANSCSIMYMGTMLKSRLFCEMYNRPIHIYCYSTGDFLVKLFLMLFSQSSQDIHLVFIYNSKTYQYLPRKL
ncbi:bifunctional L-3-cyanoalanine synthase/cysteine synthase 2, mitochondrial [Iris pallida]|uniref:Bifunctional L-3-cyanoalanine synthase/cysteine synthase 2, mitochondrial n=1 Tax=Iris pallida TaxID=29817 RepID=A0AAX6GR63_IRIPA|nr:bifunctional L-3-cyanoalanine synthase/cysteine synthase 2, mitochondrial [Iris pallida]KAJ6831250.1 bifunctional L-3-cyanoalanine synthase/cysteine synthase 2, mitochondrial [Iris pallida]